MKLKIAALALSSLILLLTACVPTGSSTVDEPPDLAEGATVSIQSPTEVSAGDQSRYEGERFSLEYPSTLTIFENERPSADGVVTPLENGIALQDSRLLLVVTSFDIVPGTNLAEFIEGHLTCIEVEANGGQEIKLGEMDARLYADTLCGLNGTTYIYAVQEGIGYRLALESGDSFAALLPEIQPILDSFRPAMPAPTDQPAPGGSPEPAAPSSTETGANLPHSQLDPGALGLLMLLQAAESLPEAWQLKPCYEAAGPFCWYYQETLTGWAGLDIKRLADYHELDDPLRQVAQTLPAPGTPFMSDMEAAVLEALRDHAERNLQEWDEREKANNPDCLGRKEVMQSMQMGPLPAVAYSYACQDTDGEMAAQVLWAEAMDQQHSYLLQSVVSSLPRAAYEQHAAMFERLVGELPLYDRELLALVPLPRGLPGQEMGDFPFDAELSPAINLPVSPETVAVFGQPAQAKPLTAEEAQAVAQEYGFHEPLTVEAHGGLSVQDAADLGLFAAFDDTRTLSLMGVPYSYSDTANWNKGPDLPFTAAKAIAEAFLLSNGWLTFPYEMAESDQGEGVLFLPVVDGITLPSPAFGVRVANNGGVAHMNIYPQESLIEIGRYPILTAEMAWPQAQFLRPGTLFRIAAPTTAAAAALPTEYGNIPAAGETGDFYTNIWGYWPLDGLGPPIIRSSEFFRVSGDPAMLAELAGQTDYLVHLQGTVLETESGLLELALSDWEVVPDAGGLPMFFGTVQFEGGRAVLVDDANQKTYWLPNAPADLSAGAFAAVAGLPRQEDGSDQLIWQKITIYPSQPEEEPPPAAEPIQAVMVTSARLVYLSRPGGEGGLPERLYIPAWEFAGKSGDGSEVTIWVPALFPEFFTIDSASVE